MKKMLFSLFAAVMAVSFIACANSSDGGSSNPEKKGSKGGDDPVVTETYTVTYDDGVAEETIDVPSDSKEYAEGDTVTVKFTGIGSRDDYTFTGWSDGTRTYTKNGTKSFTMPAQNVTLTAQWEEKVPEEDYNFAGSRWSASGTMSSLRGVRIKENFYDLEFSKKGNTVVSNRGWKSSGTYTSQGNTAYIKFEDVDYTIEFTVDNSEEPNAATDSKHNLTWTRIEDNYDIEGTTWKCHETGITIIITFSESDNTWTGTRNSTEIEGTYEIHGMTLYVTMSGATYSTSYVIDDTTTPHTMSDNENTTFEKQE